MSVQAVARPAASQSKVLYAFRHASTNQVLYSLTNELQNSALKQLPDIGANRTPATLRRDVWRPFFTVHFDKEKSGPSPAKLVYNKLREWRKLHEVYWRVPAELALNYTKEQIDTIRDDVRDNRGGSKKESPYKLIKRHKNHLRARMVMDQKANSVADLAAILCDESGPLHKMKSIYRLREQYQITSLAREAPVRLDKLERQIKETEELIASRTWQPSPEVAELVEQIRSLEMRRRILVRRKGSSKASKELVQAQARLQQLRPQTKAGLLRSIQQWKKQRAIIQFALKIVSKQNRRRREWENECKDLSEAEEAYAQSVAALEGMKSQAGNTSWSGKLFSGVPTGSPETELTTVEELTQKMEELRRKVGECRRREREALAHYESTKALRFPLNLRPRRLVEENSSGDAVIKPVTAGNIKVEWANQSDMAFAKRWPEGVQHIRLGAYREAMKQDRQEEKRAQVERQRARVKAWRARMKRARERSQPAVPVQA